MLLRAVHCVCHLAGDDDDDMHMHCIGICLPRRTEWIKTKIEWNKKKFIHCYLTGRTEHAWWFQCRTGFPIHSVGPCVMLYMRVRIVYIRFSDAKGKSRAAIFFSFFLYYSFVSPSDFTDAKIFITRYSRCETEIGRIELCLCLFMFFSSLVATQRWPWMMMTKYPTNYGFFLVFSFILFQWNCQVFPGKKNCSQNKFKSPPLSSG